MKTIKILGLIAFLGITALAINSCNQDSPGPLFQDEVLLDPNNINPVDFVSGIDNSFFSLTPGNIHIYQGTNEDGATVRVTEEIKIDTKTILGVVCMIVNAREYEDGDLIEDTFDWYAQDVNGNVWYFGEDSRDIEGGEVISTFGSWEAGVDGALPGIIMLANPQPGMKYRQEFAQGVAEDQAEIVSLDNAVTTPFGSFQNCLKTRDSNPLEPGAEEFKYYAPGVGFVRAEQIGGTEIEELAEITDLIDKAKLDIDNIDPESFVDEIDNPYLPFAPGTTFLYSGLDEEGVLIEVVTDVLTDTKEILGVICTIVREREYEDGDLIEDTFDWYTQDVEGNVWYFGEDSREIENGVVVGTAGSWEAGVDGAEPGILMLADPQPGIKYRQEFYQGEAEDRAQVISLDNTVTVPFGTFTNCLRILENSALDPLSIEYKYYAAGVGFIKVEKEGSDEFEALDSVN